MASKTQVFKAKFGQMETLHKGFLDLRKLGEVKIRRSSEILFDEDKQKFYIHYLEPSLASFNPEFRSVFFDTYEQAVDREVQFLNECRLTGKL